VDVVARAAAELDGAGVIGVEPSALRGELQRRGLVLLGVNQIQAKPDVLLVFLHGHQGARAHERARRVIARLPGVLNVAESVQSPSILLVRVEPSGPPGPPLVGS
jgi:hypothetical protein